MSIGIIAEQSLLTGIFGSREVIADTPGVFVVTGRDVAFTSVAGIVAVDTGAFVVTGQDVATSTISGRAVAEAGSFVLTGQSVTLTATVSGAWTPGDLGSALRVWLRADDILGSNGDPIATWLDASGNGYNAVGPGTTSQQPNLETASLNGLNVVRANAASGDQMSFSPNFPITESWTAATVFFVAKVVADSGVVNGPILHCDNQNSSSNHYPYSSGGVFDSFGSTTRQTVGDPTVALNTWHIGMMRSATNDWKYFQNGTQFFTTGTNTVGFHATSAPDLFVDGGLWWDGRIAELIITNTAIGSTDREKVEGFLAWKWGIESVLPGGHPYASGPP